MRIKPINPKIHEYLFQEKPEEFPDFISQSLEYHLEKHDLIQIKDTSEKIDLPLPDLEGLSLPDFLERKARDVYGKYLDWCQIFLETDDTYYPLEESQIEGWSKWDKKTEKWVSVKFPSTKVLLLDFESYRQPDGFTYLPFLCSAIDLKGNWYCWNARDYNRLPDVVSFGSKFEFGIGHNVVAYDRRYIEECYEYQTKIRFVDTLSLYYHTQGMPSEQFKLWKALQAREGDKPKWYYQTCPGGLKDLVKFFLGEDINKEIREEMQEYSPEQLKSNLKNIWRYCAKDTLNTLKVFKKLFRNYLNMVPHIVPFGGMIERSALRIGVVPDYKQRLKDVDKCILKTTESRQEIIEQCFELSKEYPPLHRAFKDWQKEEFNKRLAKTSGFNKWVDSLNEKLNENLLSPIENEHLNSINEWRKAKSNKEYKVANKILAKVVNNFFLTNTTNIKTKPYEKFCESLFKERDKQPNSAKKKDILPESFISITGKYTPLLLQIHWNGLPLEHNGDTWGVYKDEKFEELPHPKGSGNVGTPLSKDFRSKAIVGEFTSPLLDKQKNGLVKVFNKISEIAVWVSFRDRFNSIHIHNNIWLPDVVPCGTVTERMIGLAVVMPNTKEKRAGTECKHWFISPDRNHKLLRADYSSQESCIFAAHDDAVTRYMGASACSCQVYAGDKKIGTDPHTSTAKILVSLLPNDLKEELKKDICKDGEELHQELRGLAKNMNFANQFMCGVKKLATMAFLALAGKLPFEECEKLAKGVINSSRGTQNYGKYEGGSASRAYNRLKELAKESIHTSTIYGSQISKALQGRYAGKDFMTTRFNNPIQRTGQEILNTNLVTCRIISQKYDIPYQLSYLIHDEDQKETDDSNIRNVSWLMQIGHLFSKAMLYYALKVNTMPQNGAFFEEIDIDDRLRKDVKDSGITPSNFIESPPGYSIDAKDCIPERIEGLVYL
ncbi:MAG: hypothetical protein AAF316_00045 [Cyanobacteria bacterium P01_A01_bin.80]